MSKIPLITCSFISLTIGSIVTYYLTKIPPEPPVRQQKSDKTNTQPLTSNEDLVQSILIQNLGTRTFRFSQVIESSTGYKIIPFQATNPIHHSIKLEIQRALRLVTIDMNLPNSPIKKLKRVNEASRYIEDALRAYIDASPDFSCEIPKNSKGNKQRSGYPDLLVTHLDSKTKVYLDPKLYEKKSENSSFRTFYYEPKSRTIKIQHEALHLLVGVSHDGIPGQWNLLGSKIIDLSKLNVRLKAEFQTSNKGLYRSAQRVE